jgi:hypothetical protein
MGYASLVYSPTLQSLDVDFRDELLVQKVLAEKEWLNKMQPEDFRGLTPLFYGHVNPYGRLELNLNERIII